MLAGLMKSNSVNFNDSSQMVTLVSRYFICKNSSSDMVEFSFKEHLTYHTNTVVNNILGKENSEKENLFERIYRSRNIPDELIPKFRKQLTHFCNEFYDKSVDFIEKDCEVSTKQSKVLGVGLYLFELPDKYE